MTARDRRVLRDDGHRWVVVVFRLEWLWMRLHVPEERASGQDRRSRAAAGRRQRTGQQRLNCSSCAQARRAEEQQRSKR